jgi:hypothetical protein
MFAPCTNSSRTKLGNPPFISVLIGTDHRDVKNRLRSSRPEPVSFTAQLFDRPEHHLPDAEDDQISNPGPIS